MEIKTIINKINNEFKDEHGMVVLNVIPTWDEDGLLKNFAVSVSSIKDDDYTDFSLGTNLDVAGLIDLLFELRGHHIDEYSVRVYACYHGCNKLTEFYNDLMDNLDLYEEFEMEYEWG